MTCKDLMTFAPVFCVPEDSVVRAAMLMKQHDVGSIPVVEDAAGMKLAGIVTDRDITLRVVAEQRDYYTSRVSEVMSGDLVTCREDDDYDEVLKAMRKRQIRRVPVVDRKERLIGMISQADIARKAGEREVAEAVEEISEPAGVHAKAAFAKTGLLIAGGLGLSAGLMYLLPRAARQSE